MVAILPGDGQPDEAFWHLLSGAVHDSWEAICKHSSELRPRAGSKGGNKNGSNGNGNSNRGEKGGGDDNGSGKTTASKSAATTPSQTTEKAASTTPAAAKTTSTEAAPQSTKVDVETATTTDDSNKDTTTAAAAAATSQSPAAAATSQANAKVSSKQDGGNSAAAGGGSSAEAATTAAAAAPAPAPATSTPAAAAAAAATSPYTSLNTDAETTWPVGASTETAKSTGVVGAAETKSSASPSSSSSSSPSSLDSSTAKGTTSSSTSNSHAGVIAGVVIGIAALLAIAFLLFRFRRHKYLRPLLCCGGRNKGLGDGTTRLGSASSVVVPVTAAVVGRGAGTDAQGSAPAMSEKTPANGGFTSARPNELSVSDLQPPPPVSAAATGRSSGSPSSVDGRDRSGSGSVSGSTPASSRGSCSYSTFPTAARSHRYNNSIVTSKSNTSYTNNAAMLGPAVRRHAPSASLPTPPPTAVPIKEHPRQQQPTPRVAIDPVAGSIKDQPRSLPSPLAKATSAAPETLALPPMAATSRQRQSMASGSADNAAEAGADDNSTAHRTSYSSIGGSSITSSVLMSPSLLQWPVPPQTPPISLGGTATAPSEGSQTGGPPSSGLLVSRVATMPSHLPTTVTLGPAPLARRPLTTASSVSSTTTGQAGLGPMPTRAPLSGPSSRSLLQTTVVRRPSLGGDGAKDPGSPMRGPGAPGYVSPQQRYFPPAQQQPYQYQYQPHQQQQYPRPQRPTAMGYVPPQASVMTVSRDGQATSVRIPISRHRSGSQNY